MTPKKPSGYVLSQKLRRALNANKAARESLRRIIEERPSQQLHDLLLAKAISALGDNLESIWDIEEIISEMRRKEKAPGGQPRATTESHG